MPDLIIWPSKQTIWLSAFLFWQLICLISDVMLWINNIYNVSLKDLYSRSVWNCCVIVLLKYTLGRTLVFVMLLFFFRQSWRGWENRSACCEAQRCSHSIWRWVENRTLFLNCQWPKFIAVPCINVFASQHQHNASGDITSFKVFF